MTSQSSKPDSDNYPDDDFPDSDDYALHAEAARWDDEPTHEKWRRGPKWN
jgi:hypothetical protein